MRWSESQVAMLGEMGIRLWAPAEPDDDSPELAIAALPEAPAVQPARAAERPVPVSLSSGAVGTVAAMGWEDLRETVMACTACGLCKGLAFRLTGVLSPRWLGRFTRPLTEQISLGRHPPQ